MKRTVTVLILALSVVACCPELRSQENSTDEALLRAKALYSEQGARVALPEYQKVLAAYRQTANRRGEAITLGLMGNCYKRMGYTTTAFSLLNQALEIKREIHDRLEEGKTLGHLGLLYWEQGQYVKAIEFHNESLKIARELKDTTLEATALNNLSLVYDEQGDYRRSLEQYETALELHRKTHFERGESDTLGNIGGIYLSLGRYSKAEELYRQALAISRRLNLKPSEAQDLVDLGHCLFGRGKIREAIESFQDAVEIAHEAGMAKEEADGYRGKATALLRLGKFNEALENYESARETYAKAGLKREWSESLSDAASAYLAMGDRVRAEQKLLQAISESRRIGYARGVVINQLALAEVRWRGGQRASALQEVSRAARRAQALDDLAELVRGKLLQARILAEQGSLASARSYAIAAAKIAKHDGLRLHEIDALDLTAELQVKQNRPTEAIQTLDEADSLASTSGDVERLWSLAFHRGQALELQQRYDDAISAYRKSVSSIESVRRQIREKQFRIGYLQDKQAVYLALVRLLLKMDQTGDAFLYSERLREYNYLNVSDGLLAAAEPGAVKEVAARIGQLQDRIGQETSLPEARQRSQALQVYSDELLDARRDYSKLMDSTQKDTTQNRVSSAAEIANALAIDQALLEYVVDKRQLSIFVITRSGLRAVSEAVAERDLTAKVQLLRDLVAANDADEWRKPASSLYSILIGPLARRGLLKGIHSLVLVPGGVLNYLPFALLTRGLEAQRPRCLVEDYDLSTLPAAALQLTTRHSQDSVNTKVLAMAPSSAGLPFAIDEARSIARAFAPASEGAVGREATETRFKETAAGFQIIHLATHGFSNKVNPAFSGVQLEADRANDGRLEVYEILQLRLHTRLVTLSACDTALGGGGFGETPPGDEFVAVDRAFLDAGSDAVLASLFKVNDRSTLILMKRLYREISSVGGPKALARAQREMMHDARYRAPIHWGAFVFVGNDSGKIQMMAERN